MDPSHVKSYRALTHTQISQNIMRLVCDFEKLQLRTGFEYLKY